jgi:hypothetical protein
MTANLRREKRQSIEVDGMLYDLHDKALVKIAVRNVSPGGAQIEMAKEVELPASFLLALTRDGSVRRKCRKIRQFATVAGVAFTPAPDGASEQQRTIRPAEA